MSPKTPVFDQMLTTRGFLPNQLAATRTLLPFAASAQKPCGCGMPDVEGGKRSLDAYARTEGHDPKADANGRNTDHGPGAQKVVSAMSAPMRGQDPKARPAARQAVFFAPIVDELFALWHQTLPGNSGAANLDGAILAKIGSSPDRTEAATQGPATTRRSISAPIWPAPRPRTSARISSLCWPKSGAGKG